MIFVTGDTHGIYDVKKLRKDRFTEGNSLSKNDYLIICGDFGFIWENEPDDNEEYWLNWLENLPYTVLFVDGNHENLHALNTRFPMKTWNGGKAHVIRPHIFHLMRGQVYTIDGITIFTMGGARSVDRGIYTNSADKDRGIIWWDEEMPSAEEYEEARKNLEKHNNKVDVIITHDMPANYLYRFSNGMYKPNELNLFLEEIEGTVDFEKWYCGHYHADKRMDKQFRVIYDDIVPLNLRKKES